MNANFKGYYRYPSIHNEEIIFISEDDIWLVSTEGGIPRRITANLGEVTHPIFSLDGKWIAFTGREEGQTEIYLTPVEGGKAKRLTYLGSTCYVAGWKENKIIFASNFKQPFGRIFSLYSIDIETNVINELPFGLARTVSFGKKGVVIGRNTGDPARWKRYRGGTAGELWIDVQGNGEFRKLIELKGNLADPMWIGEKIFFLSDHEGIGNVYSCEIDGSCLVKHTDHKEYYARNANTDGKTIVYHHGADIFVLDLQADSYRRVKIDYHGSLIQRSRKFVECGKYLEDFSLSYDGSLISLISRGKSFSFGNWEGPVIQQNFKKGSRHKLSRFLKNGNIVLISDEDNKEEVEIHYTDGSEKLNKLKNLDIGRPYKFEVSPLKNEIAISNHKHELIWIDLEKEEVVVIDRSKFGPIAGFSWSPDGKWITYSFAVKHHDWIIKVWNIKSRKCENVTKSLLRDIKPVFDPQGKYIYFLSYRIFNPVYDQMHFDLNFPNGMKPYLVTLKKDFKSPFVPVPKCFEECSEEKKDNEKKEGVIVDIDFDGISERVIPFPVEEGIYGDIQAAGENVFFTKYNIEGSIGSDDGLTPEAKADIIVYDMKKLENNIFLTKVSDFRCSQDGSSMICQIRDKLRVISVKRDPAQPLPEDETCKRKTGWIDFTRIKVSIDPIAEWEQMFCEAWRLQKDYFWVEDMADINWEKVYKRYYPLVKRIASRSEFSDLIWEMQGELGTSHAYEFGGDYRPKPHYNIGFLGADFEYSPKFDAYIIKHIIEGDVWDDKTPPPLKRPGVNLKENMLLLSVGNKKLDKNTHPNKLLVNHSGAEIQLTVAEENGSDKRTIVVHTIDSELPLRYREWVERNRKYVHEKTNNKIGYVHIPNMGAVGYAEFHRYFLSEFDYDGLIVDVRFNGGGHVSSLLLEKLARKRLGYDVTRWMGYHPYPDESVQGPMIAITNEHAGSDGDIFSHSFKLMKLGKLIGRRTWGGVIGIWPRNWLVDGTITTQPEFSFWFEDVGWGVENYGTDPDIEVDITPQEYREGKDPQLDRGIEEVLKEVKKNKHLKPDFGGKPKKTLP